MDCGADRQDDNRPVQQAGLNQRDGDEQYNRSGRMGRCNRQEFDRLGAIVYGSIHDRRYTLDKRQHASRRHELYDSESQTEHALSRCGNCQQRRPV